MLLCPFDSHPPYLSVSPSPPHYVPSKCTTAILTRVHGIYTHLYWNQSVGMKEPANVNPSAPPHN
ncbi:hypothetical protein M405DRAFT_816303 [Rhizopogon salebrosus TDB-379]|nr:hypothetical protein M405DRAFT_816303 [Rhizopogon salebrosus TDB-379]